MSITNDNLSEMKRKHESDAAAFALGLTPEIYDQYKMAEELAHTVAYEDLNTNTTRPIYIAGIRKEIAHSVYKFQVNHAGLVAYVLCPIHFMKNHKNTVDLKIIFKGTNDLSSLQRDSEHDAPGHVTFHQNKGTMLIQLNEIIKNCKSELRGKGIISDDLEFTLSIYGHSLGGGDAQRFMLAIMQAISQNLNASDQIVLSEEGVNDEQRDQFNSIKKVVLHTFNSVGITKTDNHKAEQVSGFLTHKRHLSCACPSFEVNIFYAGGDGIQQIADTHLLYRVSKENALVRFVKATNAFEGLHYFDMKDAKNLTIKVGKTIARNFLGKGIFTGIVVAGAAYTIGLTSLAGGAISLLSSAWTLRSWFKTGSMLFSLAAGGYGTIVAHRAYYFRDSLQNLQQKNLDQYFLSSVNDNVSGQAYIMKEVNIKATVVNKVYNVYSKTRRHLARCGKKSSHQHSRIISWQYNPDPSELKLHQEELRMEADKRAQQKANEIQQAIIAAQAQAQAPQKQAIARATRIGFF